MSGYKQIPKNHRQPEGCRDSFQDSEYAQSRKYQRFMGILPAFRHTKSGETHLSCEKDGTLAPVHRTDNLPSQWFHCNPDNSECQLIDCIEKGYVVMGHFFNKNEAAQLLPH